MSYYFLLSSFGIQKFGFKRYPVVYFLLKLIFVNKIMLSFTRLTFIQRIDLICFKISFCCYSMKAKTKKDLKFIALCLQWSLYYHTQLKIVKAINWIL